MVAITLYFLVLNFFLFLQHIPSQSNIHVKSLSRRPRAAHQGIRFHCKKIVVGGSEGLSPLAKIVSTFGGLSRPLLLTIR